MMRQSRHRAVPVHIESLEPLYLTVFVRILFRKPFTLFGMRSNYQEMSICS